jgi:selenocysteine lyase/cysteine desulfurase
MLHLSVTRSANWKVHVLRNRAESGGRAPASADEAVVRVVEMLPMKSELWHSPACYFNTALRGIPPLTSVAAAQRTINMWSRGELDWKKWLDETDAIRSEFALLIGVEPARVGVGHTTAALVNVVAANVQSNSRVLIPEGEHNSNTIPFAAQRHRGITIDSAPLGDLAAAIRPHHAVVALSLVQSFDGAIADLSNISSECRRHGALLCLDLTQAAGWLPFDPGLADILVCSSYKWLMGPNGPAFIVLRESLVQSFRQLQPNWFACADRNAAPYGMEFPAAISASRYDVVPGLISASALLPSLTLINQVGIPTIHRHNTQLAAALCARLDIAHNGSAIVVTDTPDAARKLQARNIRATVRGDRVRLAIHIYNNMDEIELLAKVLS